MAKYFEQTGWLLNPTPDGRKNGRHARQCWVVGTLWVLDDRNFLTGDGMEIPPGELADKIIAHCKEATPGFGAIVNDLNYEDIIGRLIDHRKITVADIQSVLNEDQQWEEDDEDDDDENAALSLRPHLEQIEFRYRHWLSLDPPSEKMIERVAEEDWRKSILDEYKQRTQKPS